MHIRPFHPVDIPGVYNVCLLTGDSGKDASRLYHNPDLLAHVYAGPYVQADPGLAFVLADEHGLAGYIVATADTAAFEQWCAENWWPALREQYPASLQSDPGDDSQDWQRIRTFHSTQRTEDPVLDSYPAHLHIDLLPRAQGGGHGKALMHRLLAALRERGVPGLHLGVGAGNPGARAFYLKMGFTEARAEDWGSTMVMDLRP